LCPNCRACRGRAPTARPDPPVDHLLVLDQPGRGFTCPGLPYCLTRADLCAERRIYEPTRRPLPPGARHARGLPPRHKENKTKTVAGLIPSRPCSSSGSRIAPRGQRYPCLVCQLGRPLPREPVEPKHTVAGPAPCRPRGLSFLQRSPTGLCTPALNGENVVGRLTQRPLRPNLVFGPGPRRRCSSWVATHPLTRHRSPAPTHTRPSPLGRPLMIGNPQPQRSLAAESQELLAGPRRLVA